MLVEAGGPWEGAVDDLERLLEDQPVALERILAESTARIARELDADRGTLYLVDRAENGLVSRVAEGLEIREIRLRRGEGLAGWVAEHAQVVNVPGGRDDARFAGRIDALTGYRTQSVLAAPVVVEGEVQGVLQVLNARSGRFDTDAERRLVELAQRVAGLLGRTHLAAQLSQGERPLQFGFNHLVGTSPAMEKAYSLVARAAPTEATVLLRGESGTGKEALARAVHANSPRCEERLVKVDCATLPPTLVENELFGHTKGAFTGAVGAPGKVQAAHKGTLFLDEVGELPLDVQGKLLRLLQDRVVVRVGGQEEEEVDVRFILATHRDLEALVAEGRFRADLYYRMRVVEIGVPALRERGQGDLARLVEHFLHLYARRHGRPGMSLAPEAWAALAAHDWPGNVRELEHCIESAVVLAASSVITPGDLRIGPRGGRPIDLTLAAVEHAHIEAVLSMCGGNRTQAAQLLGIGRNTLARKLGQG